MSSQYTSHYHPAHIYSEQGESEPVASGLCSCFIHSFKKSYSLSVVGIHLSAFYLSAQDVFRFASKVILLVPT